MHQLDHKFHNLLNHIDKNYLVHHKIFFLFVLLPLFLIHGLCNAVSLLFSHPYHSFKFWRVHNHHGLISASYHQHLIFKKNARVFSFLFSLLIVVVIFLPFFTIQAAAPKIYIVTKTADTKDGVCDSDCSLREAIIAANASAETNKLIEFNIPVTDVNCINTICTITPSSVLPSITASNITINGYSQPSAVQNSNIFPQAINAEIKIVLDGVIAGSAARGLTINNKDNNIIKGLSIIRFNNYAIYFVGADAKKNKIQGCFIGVLPDGVTAMPNKNLGIVNNSGANNNIIGVDSDNNNDVAERNLISGNTGSGIWLGTGGGSNITIAGNFIGTDKSGAIDLGNSASGIKIESDSNNNIIGTNGDGISDNYEGNVIAGNGTYGIYIAGNANSVAGNIISCDASGDNLLQNDAEGVGIMGANVRIGTNADGVSDTVERNYLCGGAANPRRAVSTAGANTVIQGNYFGVNFTGTKSSGAAARQIELTSLSSNAVVGTDGDGINDDIEGNLISGKSLSGIIITGGSGHKISGNIIGLDASGTSAIDGNNSFYGIRVYGGNQILIGTNQDGLNDALERNIIAGHKYQEIIFEGGATNTVVAGNYIGTDISGQKALGSGTGILMGTATNISSGNRLENNVISGNVGSGIMLYHAYDNVISGNKIGVAADGITALGNKQHGIFVNSSGYGAVNTIISENVIANNGDAAKEYGVFLNKNNSKGNQILNNSFYHNFEQGIKLNQDGANNNIMPPTISADELVNYQDHLLFGLAKANSIVQLFSVSSDGEGQTYLTQTITDSEGKWSITLKFSDSNTDKIITATDTDSIDGTSEFAIPYAIKSYYLLPQVSDVNTTLDEDVVYSGTLSHSNGSNKQIAYSIVSNGSHGTAVIVDSATGAFTYTPTANYNGTDSITYQVNDGINDSNIAVLNLNINPLNDPPVAITGPDQTVDNSENVMLDSSASYDVDGDQLTAKWTKVFDASNGCTQNGTNVSTYDVAADYYCTFSLVVNDGHLDSIPDMLTIKVANDSNKNNPTASVIFSNFLSNISFTSGTETKVLFNLNDYFSEINGQALNYNVSNTANIKVNITNGLVTMSAVAGFSGSETVYFTASNGVDTVVSNSITVSVAELSSSDIDHVTGTANGVGTIKVYGRNNNDVIQWNAFSVGGVIPKIGVINNQGYIFAVKNHSGTTMHVYSTSGKIIAIEHLSSQLYWRQLTIGNLIDSDQNSDEIVMGVKRGSALLIKIYTFNASSNKFILFKRHQYKNVPANYRLEIKNRNILNILDNQGKVLFYWQP